MEVSLFEKMNAYTSTQSPLTVHLSVTIPETYKRFLEIEDLSPSTLLQQAISELMVARSMGNDRSLYNIRIQKESAIKKLQDNLLQAMSFIQAMNLESKYGDWLVLKEEEVIIRQKARENYIKEMQQSAAKEMGCIMEEAI